MADKLVYFDSPGMQDITAECELAEKLAKEIVKCIQEDFTDKHLTGLLAKSIKIESRGDGFNVVIDPIIYDIGLYLKKGVIIQKKVGSYSSQLDEQGSPWKNHQNYVYNSISKAIEKVLKADNIEAKVSGIK